MEGIERPAPTPSQPGDAPSQLSAPAPSRRNLHVPILDDARGLAIILVYLRHAEVFLPPQLDHALDHPWQFASDVLSGKIDLSTIIAYIVLFPGHLGWVALPIFYVVSGFCIHLTYCASSRPSLKAFYVRRFFRIYPAYLLALLVFATVFPGSSLPFTKLTHWAQLVSHIFQFQNLFDTTVYSINGSYWTIAIEVQLYLLFPLLLIFARRFSYAWLLFMLLLVEVSLHFFSALFFYGPGHFPPAWLRASPFFFCFSWAIGAALADAFLSGKPLPFTKIHPLVWLVPGLLTSQYPAHEFSFTLFSLGTASVIARCVTQGSVEERKSYLGRFIRRTGVYSYSLYLIHGPILIVLMELIQAWLPGIRNQPLLLFAVAVSGWLVIFPLSALMYQWVEKPGIALGKRVLRSRSQRPSDQLTTVVSAN
jgi:peptidoglycan/LPS O-acetylase OafA/YrhL